MMYGSVGDASGAWREFVCVGGGGVCVCAVVVGFVEDTSEGFKSVLEVENRCARRRRERPQDVRESGRGRAEQRRERAQSLFIVVEHRSGERVRSAAATRDRWLSLAGALAPPKRSPLLCIVMAIHSNISSRYSRLSKRGGGVSRSGRLFDEVSIMRMSITPPA